MAADGVRGFAQEAERRAGELARAPAQRVQLRRLGMLLGEVAEAASRSSCRRRGSRAIARSSSARRHDRRQVPRGLRRPSRSAAARTMPASAARQSRRARRSTLCATVMQPVVVDRMQHRHLRALARRLAQALRDERMVLAQEAADHQHAVELALSVGDRHAEPRDAVAFAVARGNRTGAGGSRCCRCRARARAARPARAPRAWNAATRARRSRPAPCRATTSVKPCATNSSAVCQSTAFHSPACLTIGVRQALGGVEPLVGEAVLVREPALVDRLVLQRQHAHHAVPLDLHDEVAAERVVRGHRLAPRELPGARGVAERLRGERADRAQVDQVAGELGVDGLADERDDLGMLAAADHAELHHAGDLLAEAHAARAVDAARHLLGGDQRAEVLVEDDALVFVVARADPP